MTKQNVEEKELTIKWLMKDDKIIKFKEIKETFDISEKVADVDFEKFGVGGGSKMSVKIDHDQGDHGTVIFMKKSVGGPATSADSDSKDIILKTVKAYGQKFNGSVLFTDDENTWYSCDKSIGTDNLPQYKDRTVEITESVSSNGKKILKSIKMISIKDGVQESNKPKNYYSNSTNQTQISIEAQACMNHANITVSNLFSGKFDATKGEDGVLVKTLIRSLARENWDIVQELKKLA